MHPVLQAIATSRIIAIVRLDHYTEAVAIAKALVAGGVTAIEWTLTGDGALQAIADSRQALGDAAQIGVGTVLDPTTAVQAIDAGAQFVVTPVLRPDVITACQQQGVPIICGAFSPTEALTAHEAGADMIKIFPARALGPHYVRDLLAPLPQLRLVPTGGIDTTNARAYLQAGAVAVGLGSNLVSASAVANAEWAQITTAARVCVAAIQ